MVAELYNMVNVPTAVWIDEAGMIVRPNEAAFALDNFRAITGIDSARYLDALRDWAKNGAKSRFVLTPEAVKQKLKLPSREHAKAAAYFRLAEFLCEQGHRDAAVPYFKRARALRPESWTITRQAFAMGDPERDYGTTFVNEVGKLKGKLYYDVLDFDGTGRNEEQEKVAREAAERLRKMVEAQGS
jgi:tetratricopeptide (TPR) repeat protein